MISSTDFNLKYKIVSPMKAGFAKAGWNLLKKHPVKPVLKKKTGKGK